MASKPITFLALDGEGWKVARDKECMTLLGSSEGKSISRVKGLTTFHALDFILALRAKYPKHTFISYYFTWDVSMMLSANLSRRALLRLANEGKVYIKDNRRPDHWYYLEYQPKKHFTVTLRKLVGGRYEKLCGVRIFDVFGFFNCSFVSALEQYHIGTKAERKWLSGLKASRKSFNVRSVRRIKKYNRLECRLLVELCNALRDRIKDYLGVRPCSWHGAGAVASSLLSLHKVDEHFREPRRPKHQLAVMSAYFGGRAQCPMIGHFAPVYCYDIASAYPHALTQIGSLAHARETRLRNYNSSFTYCVWHIRFRVPYPSSVPPLPFRNESGTIEYPCAAEGFYWTYEVEALRELYGADCFECLGGYAYADVDESVKPFAFVHDLYAMRSALKEAGNPAEKVVKMALNAMYGKTVQAVGFGGHKAPFQCYIVGGLATSYVRATMLRAAHHAPDSIIAFCTDGIISREPLPLDIGEGLGQWRESRHESVLMVKPGVYAFGEKRSRVMDTRTRGFTPDQIDWKALIRDWLKLGPAGRHHFPVRRFNGIKSLTATNAVAGWEDDSAYIDFWPRGCMPYKLADYQYACETAPYKPGISAPYSRPLETDVAAYEFLAAFA